MKVQQNLKILEIKFLAKTKRFKFDANYFFFDANYFLTLTMECYATPWRLWRDGRILWHIVELSFAFEGMPLSLSPSFICLSFLSFGGLIEGSFWGDFLGLNF